jgi:hypothetical protein
MPDAVFMYRMPAGIPGEVTRFQTIGTTIAAQVQNNTTPFTSYGQVGTIDTNGARPILAADAAAPTTPIGISVRPFPASDNQVANPGVVGFGAGTPMPKGIIDLLFRGYINMKLNGAAAAVNGAPVYVYSGVSTGNHVQAGIEAAAGANLWVLPGAFFTGPADAQGNTEIQFNI